MRLIFLSLLFLGISSMALAESDPAASEASVLEKMHAFFGSLSNLRPYMVSPEKFNAPENSQTIEAELTQLEQNIKLAAHEPALTNPSYRISRQVLQNHVSDTLRLFKYGNKDQARWSLNSTMSLCMSCHSQVPASSTSGLIIEGAGLFPKSFERAEWLFVARNFDKALEIYNNTIRSFPANKATTDQVRASLEREIAIYTRVKRDLIGAEKGLEGDLRNKELPLNIQETIRSWIGTLKDLRGEKLPNPAKATASEITDFATQYIGSKGRQLREENSRTAMYMMISGILYDYLNRHPKTELAPQILRWLASCDREINSRFFFPLVDVYLRQCIVQYPSSSVAGDCYRDYVTSVKASYSGKMPQSVTDDLNELKRNLKP